MMEKIRSILANRSSYFPILAGGIYFVSYLLLDFAVGFAEGFPNVHSWYPPSGLTFALLLAGGPAYAILVAAASVAADLWIRPLQGNLTYVFLFASCSAMVYGAGAWILRKFSGESRNDLRSSGAFGRFLLVSVLTAVVVSCVNAIGLTASGLIGWGLFSEAVLTGSIGLAVGILCVTPFLLLNVVPFAESLIRGVGKNEGFGQIHGSVRPRLWLIAGSLLSGLAVYWFLSSLGIEDRFLIFCLMCLPLIWISLVEGLESVSVAALGLSFGASALLAFYGLGAPEITDLQTLVLTASLIGMLIGSAVTESRLLAKANSYRDAVLACVSVAAEQLVARDDWKRGLTEILQRLGHASEVSHIFLVENRRLEDRDVFDETPLQWVSPALSIEEHQLRLLNLWRVHDLSKRTGELSDGTVLHYRKEELSTEDRAVLSALGLRSTCIFPIIVEQRLWGCFGLERSSSQGDWSEYEIAALKAAAHGLGSVLAQAKTEGQFRELMGNIRAVFWTSGPKGQRRTYASPAYEKLWGRSLDELRASPESWKESIHAEDISKVESGSMKQGEFDLEYRIINADGSIRWIRDRGFPIRNENGEISRIVGIAEDVSGQKEAEAKIEGSTLLLTTLIDNLGSGILVEDENRQVRHVNQVFCELFDVLAPKESLFGTDSRLLVSGSTGFTRRINEIRTGKTPVLGEELQLGELRLRLDYVPLNINEQDHYHLWQYQDITQAKRAEQQIKASLNEKEVLLQEIHHRVKNNLQIICSLLSLQSNRIHDPEVLQIFADSQNRVKAMALVHERLYKSQDLGRVDFPGYTRNLTDHLVRSYQAESRAIQLALDVQPVPMSINTAVPCGLIINELVSNALKYAFEGKQEGQISIRLSQPDPSTLLLVVKDNGIGLPRGFDLGKAETLGLKLVNGLTQQISGKISLKNGRGTEFIIQFPLDGQISRKGLKYGESTHSNR